MKAAWVREIVTVVVAGSWLGAAWGQTPLAGTRQGVPVTALAVAADGKTLATGGSDAGVRLWDVATLKELRQFKEHVGRISAVAFLPDGKGVASCCLNGGLYIWDVESLQNRMKRMKGPGLAIHALALSRDGLSLASASEDRRILVRETATNNVIRMFQGHKTSVTALAFSPDGRMLATGSSEVIHLWDAVTSREVRPITLNNQEGLRGLAFTPDGKTLAAVSKASLHLWETDSGKILHQLAGHKGGINALALAPDGKTAVTGGADGAILLWDLVAGKQQRVLGWHRGAVHGLAFVPDSPLLASGGEDGALFLWDVTRRQVVPSKSVALTAQELAGLWDELHHADVVKAYSAMGALSAGSQDALPFLRARLHASKPSDSEKRITQLILALDDNQFAVREQASSELEKIGPAAVLLLRQALEGQPSLEARRRVERLLERLKTPVITPEQRRLQRAIEVLTTIGTPEARKILEEIARDKHGEWLEQEAKTALEAMTKRLP